MKNNLQCDNHTHHLLSERKTGKAPHHNREFCGQETIWQADIDSGNTICWHGHPLQKQISHNADKFHQQEGGAVSIFSVNINNIVRPLKHKTILSKLIQIYLYHLLQISFSEKSTLVSLKFVMPSILEQMDLNFLGFIGIHCFKKACTNMLSQALTHIRTPICIQM